MKHPALSPVLRLLRPALPALLLLTASRSMATEVVILDWNHSWDYMHPMGAAAINDADFNTTWFLKAPDFTANYNGPVFGGPQAAGTPATLSTYDHGAGPGPIGYGPMEYFTAGGAEVTTYGTTLTTPNSGNRYTAYFRTSFTVAQPYTSLRLRGLIDDSALIYLDGVLVARVNRADNVEAYTTTGADGTATRNETGVSANNEACIQSILLGTAGTATQADAFVITPVTSLGIGEHTLAISVQNAANTSSDCGFGLQLLGDDAGISATVSNLQRQANGDGFADDTITFDVMVQATNLPGAFSWSSDNAAANGPVLGSYGTSATYTYPAQVDIGTLNKIDIKFTDTLNGSLTSAISVTAPPGPLGPEIVLSPANPSVGTGFEEAGLGLGALIRQTFHSELGFTSNGTVLPDFTSSGTGSKVLRFNAVNSAMTTEAVKLDPAVKGLKASVSLRAYTNSASGFEGNDSLRVSVEGSTDGTQWTDLGSVLPVLYGNDATTPNPTGIGVDQLLVKLGTGVIGEPEPRSRRGWAAKGYPTGSAPDEHTDTLTVPPFVVPDAVPVQLEFTHRYSFELDPDGTRYDGGNVQVSVNGGAFVAIPGTAFSQHGYDGAITGVHGLTNLEGFNSDSPGYLTGTMITSILTIPGVSSNDSVQIQFVGGWDYNLAGYNPNWQITDLKIKSGATTIYSEDFSAGNGGLLGTGGWFFDDGNLQPGPSYHSFSRSAIPVPAGVQYVRVKLYEPTNVVLSTSEFFLVDSVKLEVGLDPLADADGDGATNGVEELAGTNPTDPLSVFNVDVQVVPIPASPGTYRGSFTFPTADFRTWRLQASDDLQIWTDVESRYTDPLSPSLTLTNEASTPFKFWRIAISY